VLPYFVIVLPLLCFLFLILYFLVSHQKALQALIYFLNKSLPPYFLAVLVLVRSSEWKDWTQKVKMGGGSWRKGISSCRILFQEGRVGYSYWADTYFLLNSTVSTEHEFFHLKPTALNLKLATFCKVQQFNMYNHSHANVSLPMAISKTDPFLCVSLSKYHAVLQLQTLDLQPRIMQSGLQLLGLQL